MAKTLTLQYTPGKRGSDGRITGLLVDCAGTETVSLDRPASAEGFQYTLGYAASAVSRGVAVSGLEKLRGQVTVSRTKTDMSLTVRGEDGRLWFDQLYAVTAAAVDHVRESIQQMRTLDISVDDKALAKLTKARAR